MRVCRFYFRLRAVQITHRKGVHQEFTLGSFVAVYIPSGNTRKTEEKKERERERGKTRDVRADHRIASVHFVIDSVRSARSRDIGRSSGRRRDKSVSTRRRSSKFHEREGARERKTRERVRGERESGRKTRTEKEVPREESKADWEGD